MNNNRVEWSSEKMIKVLGDYDFNSYDNSEGVEWFEDDTSDELLIIDHSLRGGAILVDDVKNVRYFTAWNDELASFYDRVLKG